MKEYHTIFATVLMVSCLGLLSSVSGQWIPYTIEDNLVNATLLDIGDLDGDGDKDLAISDWRMDAVFWYENDFPTWQRHDIAMLQGAVGCVIADMDNDDTLDVVAAGFSARDVVWYENNLPEWTTHIIDGNIDGEDLKVGDMDGDSDLDVVITATSSGQVIWYENINLTWTEHIIDNNLVTAYTLELVDIDGDDTLDVVATGRSINTIVCYENDHPTWTKYTIDENLQGVADVHAGDLDGNGTQDVVAAGEGYGVVWYKNDHPTWTKYSIDENLPGANGVYIADMGAMRELDVLATGFIEKEIVWYENNLPTWNEHVIDDDSPASGGLIAYDFDNDGNVDVCAWGNKSIVYYDNKPAVARAILMQSWHSKYIPPEGETITINAQLYNPENHLVSVFAVLKGEQHAYADSIPLYDDGAHNDSLSSDDIWGNSKWLIGLPEDIYTIEVSSYDIIEDFTYNLPSTSTFTTIGPIVIDSVSAPTFSVFTPNRGTFYVYIKNKGQITTAEDVSMSLYPDTTDLCLIGLQIYREFGDIEPGQRASGRFTMTIDTSCLQSDTIFSIPFTAKIASGDHVYWTDINGEIIVNDIEEFSKVRPVVFKLNQNYPNPFNPTTIINYELPTTNFIDLSIYNLLGQKVVTLVNERKRAGSHQVEWDASGFSSGVYYYRIDAGEFVNVKKMILLR